MARKYDLFLSYNSRDQAVVRQIYEALKLRELNPWFDRDALTLGRLWQAEAEKGLKSCRAAAVFIGPSGIGPWENLEMRALLTRVAQEGLPLIPVHLPGSPEKLELPPFLSELNSLNLRPGITEEGIAELVRGIPKARKKSKAPATPINLGPPRLHNNLPPALGDWLKGRDNELNALGESLESGRTENVQKYKVLYGLGGIGKTRLAVEYAWRFGFRYTAAFLVRVDSPEKLNPGIADLARADLLDLPERKVQGEEETVHAVVRWLKLNPGWLLILDNVDTKEAEAAVLVFLERLIGGHVLITSRLRDWPRNRIHTQQIGTISLEEARNFLLKRTDGDRRAAADDAERARDLAEKLGGLPLALEQAGAYISYVGLSFSEYLTAWEEDRERVLKWYDPVVMDYPDSLAVAWQRSFDRLSPTAAVLLRIMAFLSPEPVPLGMIESAKDIVARGTEMMISENQKERDRSSIPEALAELNGFSLITRQDASVVVHRVVQEVLQLLVPPNMRANWRDLTTRLMDNYYYPLDTMIPQVVQRDEKRINTFSASM